MKIMKIRVSRKATDAQADQWLPIIHKERPTKKLFGNNFSVKRIEQ